MPKYKLTIYYKRYWSDVSYSLEGNIGGLVRNIKSGYVNDSYVKVFSARNDAEAKKEATAIEADAKKTDPTASMGNIRRLLE